VNVTNYETLDVTDSSYSYFLGPNISWPHRSQTPPFCSKYSTTLLTRDAQIPVPKFFNTFVHPWSRIKLRSSGLLHRVALCARSEVQQQYIALTPCSRVLLEKLTSFRLVKKFPAFYGNRRFITAGTNVRHLSLSSASSFQSVFPHPTSWRFIVIYVGVCVCVDFVICGCFDNWVGVLVICVIVFTVFLYCLAYVHLFLFVTSVRATATEWKLNCSK
jgi:hypothetical protein